MDGSSGAVSFITLDCSGTPNEYEGTYSSALGYLHFEDMFAGEEAGNFTGEELLTVISGSLDITDQTGIQVVGDFSLGRLIEAEDAEGIECITASNGDADNDGFIDEFYGGDDCLDSNADITAEDCQIATFDGTRTLEYEFDSIGAGGSLSDCSIAYQFTYDSVPEFPCPYCNVSARLLIDSTNNCDGIESDQGYTHYGIDFSEERFYYYNSVTSEWLDPYQTSSCNSGKVITTTDTSISLECRHDDDDFSTTDTITFTW